MDRLIRILSLNKRLIIAFAAALCLHGIVLFLLSDSFPVQYETGEKGKRMAVSVSILSLDIDERTDKPPVSTDPGRTETDPDVYTVMKNPASKDESEDGSEDGSGIETPQMIEPQKVTNGRKEANEMEPVDSGSGTEIGIETADAADAEVSQKKRGGTTHTGRETAAARFTGTATPPTWESLIAGRSLAVPQYPSAAKRFGYEGVVRIAFTVTENGSVEDVRLLESSGHSILDREVISTITSSWSFHPPGRKLRLIKEFAFELER